MIDITVEAVSPKSGRTLTFVVSVPDSVQAYLDIDGESKVLYNLHRQFTTDVQNKARAMLNNRKKYHSDAAIIAACTKLKLAAGPDDAETKAAKVLAKLDPAVVAALKAMAAPKAEDEPEAEDEPKTEEAPKA